MPRIHRPRSAPERIGRFRGKFAFLSNFHRHPFDSSDHTVPTAEHAFQSAKTQKGRERDRCPRLFADTVRQLFEVDRDIALDEPLDAVLNALAADSNATETAP